MDDGGDRDVMVGMIGMVGMFVGISMGGDRVGDGDGSDRIGMGWMCLVIVGKRKEHENSMPFFSSPGFHACPHV